MSKPFISGFTIVRNAAKYDYPILESINSILPLVDEYIVAVGESDDNTLSLIQNIASSKIKIVRTVWNDNLRKGGVVLAEETNKALDAVSAKADWCFYLQGDEVFHEKYSDEVMEACQTYLKDEKVEGLLFHYEHFYGSYDYTGDSRKWYRGEIRIIRNDKQIRSYKDAQGFRKNGKKLKVKALDAYIYHYGWVKEPGFQQAKQETFHKMWHDDNWVKQHVEEADEYDSLKKFEGTHPAAMQERLKRMNWQFHFDTRKKKFRLKDWLLYKVEKITGMRLFEYKNYEIV